MILFGTILYILLVMIIKAAFWISISPILLGLVILILGNLKTWEHHKRHAPILWDLATVALTVFATSLL